MWEFKTGSIFGATCFTSFGAFWLGLALMKVLEAAGIISAVPPAGLAVFLAAWGFFTFYATFAAIKAPRGLLVLFITLTITFFLLAGGEYVPGLKLAGGYLGIAVALIAWYDSAAILLNNTWDRKVLPF
jgi:succinate-acetate transporter protein